VASNGSFIREVALSVIERHSLSLQAEKRHILGDIKEAKRSRQRREKLLRLAREKGFQFCLEQLSRPGMTLERSPYYGVFVEYDRRTTLEHQALLEERLRNIRRDIRQARSASPEPVEANLRGLLDETELTSKKPPEVQWTVENVELEGVWIGDLEVNLALDEFRVEVWNRSVDTDDKGGYQHPHVSSEGAICWGDNETAAQAYHRAGDFLALKDLIGNLLHTYNSRSPYINLDDWVNGMGESCYECGERYSEDDLVWAEDVEGSLCESCRSYCQRCEQYVSYQHYDRDFDACQYCVEDHAIECGGCGEKHWEDDLETVEIAWFDQPSAVLVCKDCLAKFQEQEESNEDLDDTARLLASAMDGAANGQRSLFDGPLAA